VSVRSVTGADTSEVRADHKCSLRSGVMATDSRASKVAIHSAA
jgi:hypothetical protein